MMPAAKMMDPVMGIDIHIIQPPGPVPPLPIPHPFVGMLFDPMELAPIIGATVFVNGMPKATAGSEGKALPPHIPIGGMFVPPPPGNECEMFMGSSTVLFEGEPASYTALPALSCQSIGMPAPFRPKKKPKPIMKLPLSVVMPIPAGPPVLIGGPPTISLTVIGMKIVMGAAMKAAKKLKKAMKASKRVKAASDKVHKAAKKAMDKLGVPPSVQNKVHKGICTVTGHPVDVATGKVFTDNVDFEIPGPIPLRWERTWFSTSVYQGPLGHGWHHNYDIALMEEAKAVAIRAGDGRPMAFPRLNPGDSFYLRSEKSTLARDHDGYFLLTKDRLIHRFSPTPLSKGEHPLASISDTSGNMVRFHYDAQGRLEAIRDSANRVIKLHTDWNGRILRILGPHPDDHAQEIVMVSYKYDDFGDLTEAKDALSQAWRFTYRNHLLVKETNRNGLSFFFEYDGTDTSAKCLRTWGDGGIYAHKLVYDTDKKTTTVENSLGSKVVYHLADSGLVTKVVDALGGISITEFNDFNEVLMVTDQMGLATEFTYDDRGNRVKERRPDGAVTEYQFEQDLPVGVKDPLGNVWKWEFDDRKRLVKKMDPLGQVVEYRYEGSRLATVVDPVGGETRFEYGPSGEIVLMETPEKALYRWKYDRLGRCLISMDPSDNERRCTFDLLGRIRKVEEPDGNLSETEYNPEGRPILVRDGHRKVLFGYQGMNRLAFRAEQGITVEFKYDTEERLVGIKNEHGTVYGFELDPAGDVASESGFDGIRRRFIRDSKGRITTIERAGGLSTKYKYDPSDRIIQVLHSNGEKDAFKYRADGEMLEASNDATKVLFKRDALGRILAEDQDGRVVESKYDLRGLRINMTSSMGAHQVIQRNSSGDVTGVSYGSKDQDPAWETRISRDIVGCELERSLPGGLKSRWSRDKLGRPLRHSIVTAKEFRARDYNWDINDRLKSIRDSRHGLTLYEYDPTGNLAWAETPDGSHLFRMPDAVGNLFRSPDRDDRKYGPAGQLLEARGSKGMTRYEYDTEGNLIRKTEPGDKVWSYQWNAGGMLSKVLRPDGESVEFGYDALGRRTRKVFRGKITKWVWDGNVPLHEWVEANPKAISTPNASPVENPDSIIKKREADLSEQRNQAPPATGTEKSPITWLFEPESFSPMAKILGEERYSIITDHMGAPLIMADSSGVECWSAVISAYGDMRDIKGDKHACPFRWPGQYEDSETGLFYNRFRYYDPEAGQYTSPDPIGLAGGPALYGYVHDPLAWSDPFGLACGPAAKQNSRGQWIDSRGRFAHPPDVASLPSLKGKSVGEVEDILTSRGYTRTNPANPKNQRWTHPDGSEVQIHAYGNTNTTPFKGANNAHAHKSLGRHGNPGTTELADDGRTAVSTHSAEAHIGMKNPQDYPTVAGRPHGT